MNDRLDRSSPVPLYHQIAEALRNGIAVGELQPGERLPPVRKAAEEWGVNLHTVRRAYGELESEGLVRVRGPLGTEVSRDGAGLRARRSEADEFVAEFVRTARERFGLSAAGLARLLVQHETGGVPLVHVIECSREQAEGHCRELERAWRVEAKPLVLSEIENLPPGAVIATYFHYNEIRQRWPRRLSDVRFVAIAPDATLPERVPARVPGETQRLSVCEFDAAKSLNIAADLKSLFPIEGYEIEPRVLASPHALPVPEENEVLLVAPRVWGALSGEQRERVVHIRYAMSARELETLGEDLGWHRATRGEER
jgi:GntR family transcriptional regulator